MQVTINEDGNFELWGVTWKGHVPKGYQERIDHFKKYPHPEMSDPSNVDGELLEDGTVKVSFEDYGLKVFTPSFGDWPMVAGRALLRFAPEHVEGDMMLVYRKDQHGTIKPKGLFWWSDDENSWCSDMFTHFYCHGEPHDTNDIDDVGFLILRDNQIIGMAQVED